MRKIQSTSEIREPSDQEERKCRRCNMLFRLDSPDSMVCRYHPGRFVLQCESLTKGGTGWSCCGAQSEASLGCKVAKHGHQEDTQSSAIIRRFQIVSSPELSEQPMRDSGATQLPDFTDDGRKHREFLDRFKITCEEQPKEQTSIQSAMSRTPTTSLTFTAATEF
jgi:hypothetical protein